MQVVILCGGRGTRIAEVSDNAIPKAMVPVGRRPIVWHIMKYYAEFGHDDFVLCLGHLGASIKEYFLNFETMFSDLTVSLRPETSVQVHRNGNAEDWRVTLAETGLSTMTAGRVRRVAKYLTDDNFTLTYGDGVSDVDLAALEAYHLEHGKLITITGVIPPGRFGELHVEDGQVTRMEEKPEIGHHRHVNGGFMVVNRGFIDAYLTDVDDDMPLEREPMERAAKDGEMMMWAHDGFWQPMDTPRDWTALNEMWKAGDAPWKIW